MIQDPQRDLPAGLRGGSDVWDAPQASVVLQSDFFPTAAEPQTATGTLSATEPAAADTAAASGRVVVQGALAVAESGADALAAAGVVPVAGVLAAAESGGSDAAAVAGGVLVQGELSAAEAGVDAMAATGTVTGDTPEPPEPPAQGGGRPWRFVASVPIPVRPRRPRRKRDEELALI